MDTELRLFDDQERVDLTESDRVSIYEALQALFSPRAEDRSSGIEQIRSLDGHSRSPLAASALAHRLHEPNIKLLAEVVDLLASVILDANSSSALGPSRRWVSYALRHLGKREIDNLLQLAGAYEAYPEKVAVILNECSLAGEMLVSVFTDGKRDLAHRLSAIELIDRVGFLEAVPMIKHWITRLTSRQERQMRMSFAPAPDSETDAILPALRLTLTSLEGGGQE